MASLVPRLAPGSTFAERYRILSYVGQGSMGAVYRAEPLEGGPALALKLVNLEATPDGRAARRFEREAESGSRIQSPYVVRTLASGQLTEKTGWLALEFAEGVTFDELVAGGALPVEVARRVLAQLFAALAAAHAEGIVHRDLKPDNVRVAGAEGAITLKVLDFGIAKDFGVNTMSGTSPGLGTPLWTAPEQSRDGYQPVPNADVWSLGLLTFFALTGRQYWLHTRARASMADLAIELIKGDISTASERARELDVSEPLPFGFDGWFARAVNREPTQRFRDAGEAWRALEPLLTRPVAEAPRERSIDRASVVVPRSGVFLVAVFASVFVAGLAIYWLLRSMHI